jgi:hypothetical protein
VSSICERLNNNDASTQYESKRKKEARQGVTRRRVYVRDYITACGTSLTSFTHLSFATLTFHAQLICELCLVYTCYSQGSQLLAVPAISIHKLAQCLIFLSHIQTNLHFLFNTLIPCLVDNAQPTQPSLTTIINN